MSYYDDWSSYYGEFLAEAEQRFRRLCHLNAFTSQQFRTWIFNYSTHDGRVDTTDTPVFTVQLEEDLEIIGKIYDCCHLVKTYLFGAAVPLLDTPLPPAVDALCHELFDTHQD